MDSAASPPMCGFAGRTNGLRVVEKIDACAGTRYDMTTDQLEGRSLQSGLLPHDMIAAWPQATSTENGGSDETLWDHPLLQ